MSEPLMTVKEHLRSGQGLGTLSRSTITLYDDHVECATPGMLGSGGTDSIRYEQIAHVVVNRGVRWATLGVQTTGSGGFAVGGLKKDEAEAAKRLIDERVAAARAPAPVVVTQAAAPGLAEQIAQLAALRDSGVLSEEEFAASKARLIGEAT
jgi:Short C-terminal domain